VEDPVHEDLSAEWLRNEAALLRLRDLPAREKGPAARDRELERRQDEIEFPLGADAVDDDREESPT